MEVDKRSGTRTRCEAGTKRRPGRNRAGVQTRALLLSEAERLFAEHGVEGVALRDITAATGSNIAAINYHFGSKDQLYAHVWRRAFEAANAAYPPEGGLGPEAAPEGDSHPGRQARL